MVQIISGKKGKGKTKHLLEKVNASIKEAHGTIVYLDKNTKHMFELNNRVRLIDVSQYPIKNYDGFLGFICGIISQDHDLEEVYLDSFLTLAYLDQSSVEQAIDDLNVIGAKYDVTFILSISEDKEHLPANAQDKVIISL
ncbi:MAG: twitching motility protein PilT [Lachnospiraceae bacterium]|nr:twitching motility protein PilT [Lachnospiraceae bacterium]